jgi:hypothetical protein
MSVAESGTLTVSDVRARAALALAPADPGDPDVHDNLVDAPSPPSLMLLWDDPWLEPEGVGSCIWKARLEVRCFASRVDPGAGIEKLEELVVYVLERMRADTYPWPVALVDQPGIHYAAGVPYLGARVLYQLRVSL